MTNTRIPSLATLTEDLAAFSTDLIAITERVEKLEATIAAVTSRSNQPLKDLATVLSVVAPIEPIADIDDTFDAGDSPTKPTKTWHIVAYRQYGNWSVTLPFDTLRKAEVHANMYLRNTEHVKDITFLVIELPE